MLESLLKQPVAAAVVLDGDNDEAALKEHGETLKERIRRRMRRAGPMAARTRSTAVSSATASRGKKDGIMPVLTSQELTLVRINTTTSNQPGCSRRYRKDWRREVLLYCGRRACA